MHIIANNPALRLVPPRFDRVELLEPFEICHPMGRHIVPAGVVCDLESVPQCLQWLYPKLSRGALAGIAHDDLYRRGEFPRVVADAVYCALLRHYGVGWTERSLKYLSLRLVGGIAWNAHRRKQINPPA